MILSNGMVATLDPQSIERTDLRIEGDSIAQRGPMLRPVPGEEVLELDGALVLPGLVNAHTHLYSALARGMPGPAEPPRSFVEILEKLCCPDGDFTKVMVIFDPYFKSVEERLNRPFKLMHHPERKARNNARYRQRKKALEKHGLDAAPLAAFAALASIAAYARASPACASALVGSSTIAS